MVIEINPLNPGEIGLNSVPVFFKQKRLFGTCMSSSLNKIKLFCITKNEWKFVFLQESLILTIVIFIPCAGFLSRKYFKLNRIYGFKSNQADSEICWILLKDIAHCIDSLLFLPSTIESFIPSLITLWVTKHVPDSNS